MEILILNNLLGSSFVLPIMLAVIDLFKSPAGITKFPSSKVKSIPFIAGVWGTCIIIHNIVNCQWIRQCFS